MMKSRAASRLSNAAAVTVETQRARGKRAAVFAFCLFRRLFIFYTSLSNNSYITHLYLILREYDGIFIL